MSISANLHHDPADRYSGLRQIVTCALHAWGSVHRLLDIAYLILLINCVRDAHHHAAAHANSHES